MENSVKIYLELAVRKGAADMFLIAGRNVVMKQGAAFLNASVERLTPKDSEKLVRELYDLAERPIPENASAWDDDFALSLPGLSRFRVNAFKQRGSWAAVIRVVKFGVPNWKAIGITENVMRLTEMTRGLALVTGPAGSGKSTTLACVIDAINRTRNCHIITIEDPIEYLHRNQLSIVSQREIAMDTENYVTALRASLRQSPDVILLDEMRGLETIQIAMTAAETGHFVISTLHTVGAANTIDRIIDVFPPDQQQQVRVQLSQVLRAVVSQQLLPAVGGGLVPAFEVMRLNNAIRNLVRDNRTQQIDSVIQASAAEGMISMDESIFQLRRAGKIAYETALYSAVNPEQLQRRLPR